MRLNTAWGLLNGMSEATVQNFKLGSFRRATQRAVRRRKQPALTVLHSSGRSRMSDAAQPCIVCVHVMHERIPSPEKVSDWLILQLRRTSRTNLIFGAYRSGFEGYAGFQVRNYANCRNLHTTRTI